MIVAKLVYKDKDEAVHHLTELGLIVDGVKSNDVVFVGALVQTKGTYDEEGNELTTPIYYEGYHVDVANTDLDFGAHEVTPINAKHKILGEEF